MNEALRRLDGVTSISETPDPVTWTCEMTTREGRLPSLSAITGAVRAVGNPFSVRGIEVVVDGSVEMTSRGPVLRASGTGERFALAPATRKVQWDSRTKQDQPLSGSERSAYERFTKEVLGQTVRVRVMGRVVDAGPKQDPILEIRTFSPLQEPRL